MGHDVFGAFTLLVIVNGQDVTVQCSVCGQINASTVDRAERLEARMRVHISSHIHFISQQLRPEAPIENGTDGGYPLG
jgi:uncharacterized Zn finger protein